MVATVLTACGIETYNIGLQRLLNRVLQQCLPLAVLKLDVDVVEDATSINVATVLTACGIETREIYIAVHKTIYSCNSAYRLRY